MVARAHMKRVVTRGMVRSTFGSCLTPVGRDGGLPLPNSDSCGATRSERASSVLPSQPVTLNAIQCRLSLWEGANELAGFVHHHGLDLPSKEPEVLEFAVGHCRKDRPDPGALAPLLKGLPE